MIDPRERQANNNFSDYVQSVAFHLTLSRRMIEGLTMVRDALACAAPRSEVIKMPGKERFGAGTVSHFVPIMWALERRGLVWHDDPNRNVPLHDPKHVKVPLTHRYHRLTRAGELVCALLVEAGLMMPVAEVKQRKRA